jgi:hypothetical protein
VVGIFLLNCGMKRSFLICGIIGAFLLSASCSYATESNYTTEIAASDDVSCDLELATPSVVSYAVTAKDMLHSYISFNFGSLAYGGEYSPCNCNADIDYDSIYDARGSPES